MELSTKLLISPDSKCYAWMPSSGKIDINSNACSDIQIAVSCKIIIPPIKRTGTVNIKHTRQPDQLTNYLTDYRELLSNKALKVRLKI
jgi:hypothetical protein